MSLHRALLFSLSVLLLASCQHGQPAGGPSKSKTSALVKRAGKYAWRVQLTVQHAGQKSPRTVWFTVPHAGTLPLDDCTQVSAAVTYGDGSGWLQPGGPKWHGYLVLHPEASPPTLEIHCIERSSCACRHFEKSDFSGVHPVTKVGVWRSFPRL